MPASHGHKALAFAFFFPFCFPAVSLAQVISQNTADLIATIQSGDQAAIEQALAKFDALTEAEKSRIISEVRSLDPIVAAELTQQLEATSMAGIGATTGLTATALGSTVPFFFATLLAALAATQSGSTSDTN